MNKRWLTCFLAAAVILALIPGSGCKKSDSANNESVKPCELLDEDVSEKNLSVILYTVPAIGDFSNHVYFRMRSYVSKNQQVIFGEYDEGTGRWHIENLSVNSLIVQDNDLVAEAWVQLLDADGIVHQWYRESTTRTIKVFDITIKAMDGSNPVTIPTLILENVEVSGKPITVNGHGSVDFLGIHAKFSIIDSDFDQNTKKVDYGPYDYAPINGRIVFSIEDSSVTMDFNGGKTVDLYTRYGGSTYACTLAILPNTTWYSGQ